VFIVNLVLLKKEDTIENIKYFSLENNISKNIFDNISFDGEAHSTNFIFDLPDKITNKQCKEMETFDFYSVCEYNNVKNYCCIRIISDNIQLNNFENYIHYEVKNDHVNYLQKKSLISLKSLVILKELIPNYDYKRLIRKTINMGVVVNCIKVILENDILNYNPIKK